MRQKAEDRQGKEKHNTAEKQKRGDKRCFTYRYTNGTPSPIFDTSDTVNQTLIDATVMLQKERKKKLTNTAQLSLVQTLPTNHKPFNSTHNRHHASHHPQPQTYILHHASLHLAAGILTITRSSVKQHNRTTERARRTDVGTKQTQSDNNTEHTTIHITCTILIHNTVDSRPQSAA